MELLAQIDALIAERHLLTHPFYTKWVEGTLPKEAIQDYARQYYAFESEFPRYLSSIHTRTEQPELRQHLLDNLWDEEHGEENHAELWMRFAEAMGVSRDDVTAAESNEGTARLLATYRAWTKCVAGGVAAIHAYEAQVPKIAEAKIAGLKDHYGVDDEESLKFWNVHRVLDVEHSEAERTILSEIAATDPDEALASTGAALDAWWGFLDAVDTN